MSFYGLLNLPWWGYVAYTLIMTHITMIAISLYLHRAQSHRALDIHPAVAHFFRFWLWLTTGMKTKEWVAVHRKHHAKCETPEDPHSPVVEGIWTVLLEGTELYRYAKKDPDTLERYGKGTPNDWVEKHVYSAKFMRGKQGVALLLAINLLLLGVPGLIVWAIQLVWTPFFAAGIVNGIGHYFGYRNFECPDAARNILPWGFLVCGEELHNNHHTYGNSAKLSVKPWEFDIGWMYIKILSFFKLAEPKRLPPKVVKELELAHNEKIDLTAIEAIVNNKIAVFSQYTKEVVVPAMKKKALCFKTKRLLKRHPNLLSSAQKEQISSALTQSEELEVVMSFRDRLNQIWSKTTTSNQELMEAFQDWCKQAEKTGIKRLEHFARRIKSYRLKKATNQ